MRLLKSCDVTIRWEHTSYVSNQLFGIKIKAAKDKAKKTLEEQGCKVEVSDLYDMKFKVGQFPTYSCSEKC